MVDGGAECLGGIGSGSAKRSARGESPGYHRLTACERLLGMILVMLSVQMLLDGISN